MPRLFTRLLLLLAGFTRRLRSARRAPRVRVRPPQPRRPQAAKPPYDLEKDASTDNQKYLM
jgi:hypothetical protein